MQNKIDSVDLRVEYKFAQTNLYAVNVVAWVRFGKWAWNVYAYIYENNTLFAEAKDKIYDAPFHGGVTLEELKTTAPAFGIKYKWQKIHNTLMFGSDYMHYGDLDYSEHSPFGDKPLDIFRDAERLVAWLKINSSPIKQGDEQ